MQTMMHSAVSAYAKAGVDVRVPSASPHELILMLYEGAVKAILFAKMYMSQNEIAPKCEMIAKAIAIIDQGLKISLDEKVGGELAQNLKALYDYMCSQLLLANLHNEPKYLDEVSQLLGELKGAWEAIGKPAAAPTDGAPISVKQAV